MDNWKQFKYRNLWQHPIWGRFQEKIGRKVIELSDDEARAQMIKYRLPLGLCWMEVPRGPLFKTESGLKKIMDRIAARAKKEKAVFVRLSAYQELTGLGYPLVISSSDHHPETSLTIDLGQSEDEIQKQMKQKGRYNIKVAEKHQIQVEPDRDIDAFYEILSKTANRDGFHIHPKEYYRTQIETLGEHAQLLLAKYQDRVIAGGVFIYLDDWGIYYYGASDHHYRKYMAPYLIQWEAIKEAKRRGCRYYDFLGIAPEGAKKHRWAGVTDFKKKFGGSVVSYPQAKELILRRFWYFMYDLYKKVR